MSKRLPVTESVFSFYPDVVVTVRIEGKWPTDADDIQRLSQWFDLVKAQLASEAKRAALRSPHALADTGEQTDGN